MCQRMEGWLWFGFTFQIHSLFWLRGSIDPESITLSWNLEQKWKEAGRRMCWAYKNIFTFVPFYGHKKTTKTFRVTQCCIMRVLCDSLPLLCMKLNTYVGVAADRDASPACLNHLPSSHTYTHTHRHAYKRAHAGRQQTFSFCHSGGMQSVTWPHHQPGG